MVPYHPVPHSGNEPHVPTTCSNYTDLRQIYPFIKSVKVFKLAQSPGQLKLLELGKVCNGCVAIMTAMAGTSSLNLQFR